MVARFFRREGRALCPPARFPPFQQGGKKNRISHLWAKNPIDVTPAKPVPEVYSPGAGVKQGRHPGVGRGPVVLSLKSISWEKAWSYFPLKAFSARRAAMRPHKAPSQKIGRELGTHKRSCPDLKHQTTGCNVRPGPERSEGPASGVLPLCTARTRSAVRVPRPDWALTRDRARTEGTN